MSSKLAEDDGLVKRVTIGVGGKLIVEGELDQIKADRPNTFSYQLMRKTTVKNSRSKKLGAIMTVANLSKGAAKLFGLIDESRAKDDWFAVLDPPKSRSEATLRSRAFTELRKEKLVKRGRQSHTFMISPEFLIPSGEELQGWLEAWNSLEPRSDYIRMPYQYK